MQYIGTGLFGRSTSVLRSCRLHDISFGDVTRSLRLSRAPELVPALYEPEVTDQHMNSHLRWMAQKDKLGQDIFLVGLPGSYRRRLALCFAELMNREVEFITLSRDTTETDIKQRREIISGATRFVDQASVRAAIHGRLLIIEGIEKAERNILPVLNNLLENREMHLDDGRFLVSAQRFDSLVTRMSKEQLEDKKFERVSEEFRVIALGLPVPKFKGNPLDPPIRSRFQCRNITVAPFKSLYSKLAASSALGSDQLSQILSFAHVINSAESSELGLPHFPISNLDSVKNLNGEVDISSLLHRVYPYKLFGAESSQRVEDALEKCGITAIKEPEMNQTAVPSSITGSYCSNSVHDQLLKNMKESVDSGCHLCLVGPRGCGKSVLTRELARLSGCEELHTVMIYRDMTARDLLQHRVTSPSGDTTWSHSPLVEAALEGQVVVLDGIHRVDSGTLVAIQRFAQDGEIDLFDGTRLLRSDRYEAIKSSSGKDDSYLESRGIFRVNEKFRMIALAEPPEEKNLSQSWLSSEIISMFQFHVMDYLPLGAEMSVCKKLFPDLNEEFVDSLCRLSHEMRSSNDPTIRNLSSSFSSRQLIRILRAISEDSSIDPNDLISKAFMPQFLPSLAKESLEEYLCKRKLQTSVEGIKNSKKSVSLEATSKADSNDGALVPMTLFYDNEEQSRILDDLKKQFDLGEHLLLVGNQGVGKNKLADKLLNSLNKPRQYIQLHRDSTVQSITVQPNVKDGHIVFEDSPLVKAARLGHVLVVDEADKAPTHVTYVLKSLVEDRHMYLPDGRRIVPHDRVHTNPDKDIMCHPDFRIIVLANRPGFPFLGNDFFASLGDLFSCHAIENPGKESQLELLRNYAPNVDQEILHNLINAFSELRDKAEEGSLSYPYSTRELVNVARHLEAFPDDGVCTALRNVFDFDHHNDMNMMEVSAVLRRNGIPFGATPNQIYLAKQVALPSLRPMEKFYQSSENQQTIKINTRSIKLAKLGAADALSGEVKVTHPRSDYFQEQSIILKLPIDKRAFVCDAQIQVTEGGRKGFVATCNPTALLTFSMDGSSRSSEFDLHSLMRGSAVEIQPLNSHQVFVLSPKTRQMCLVNCTTGQVEQIDLGISSQMSSLFSRSGGKRLKIIRGGSKDNRVGVMDAKSGEMFLFDFNNGSFSSLSIGDPIKSAEFIGSSSIRYVSSSDATFVLENIDMKETFAIPYKGTQISEMRFSLSSFNSAEAARILGENISASAKLCSSQSHLAGISIGFPDLSSGQVFGIPRENQIVASRSCFLPPSFSVVNLVDTRYIPRDHLPEDLKTSDFPNCLEWVELNSGIARYLPLEASQYHPLVSGDSAMSKDGLLLLSDEESHVYTVDAWGTVREFEVNEAALFGALEKWRRMIGRDDQPINIRKSSREATGPKHGKVDPTGDPHVGGNTWAGGTGGADTAGLGGIGGPYRLDAGHKVHQVPDEMKQNVPPHVLQAAKEMRDKAFAERMSQINMNQYESDLYASFYDEVSSHISSIRIVLESLQAKQKDREWLRNQTSGELDDNKIVDSILGEKAVFRRRAEVEPMAGAPQANPKHMRLLVDCSGSMYRFNGYDQRLQRQLEACCMMMEAFHGFEDRFRYDMYGHSGEDSHIPLVSSETPPKHEKDRLKVLHTIHAHSQFCLSGDNTIRACVESVKDLAKMNADERFLVLLSDANFSRYRIPARSLVNAMTANGSVNTFVIFIGSLGDQAASLQAQLPSQSAFVCMDTKGIPAVLRKIFTSTLLKS